MKRNLIIKLLFIILTFISISSCKKFLDAKPDQKLNVPSSIEDLEALTERYREFNQALPIIGEVSSDNYYITDLRYQSLPNQSLRNTYTWQKDVYDPAGPDNEWVTLYKSVLRANIVLENVDKVPHDASNHARWTALKGNSLFFRAFQFLNAVSVWGLAYDESTANTDLGIPLRLSSDFNVQSTRSSIKETYLKICNDLMESATLLPDLPNLKTRASKAAAYALLSRTYLYMRNYKESLKYANLSLQINDRLLNFANDPEVDLVNPFGFTRFNKEVLYDAAISGISQRLFTSGQTDTLLLSQYEVNDLRRTMYWYDFGGTIYYTGMYNPDGDFFAGLANDEVYLTRAECYARLNQVDKAMDDLNKLMVNRYNEGTFTPLTASSSSDAIKKILIERRKELYWRGTRWMDIKRLNKDGANIIQKRVINGQVYTLEPNSPKYALPIPNDVIAITGMPQNPR